MTISRRQFLTFLGAGTYSLLRETSLLGAAFPLIRPRAKSPKKFAPLSASSLDQFQIPSGYRYDLVAKWGDSLGTKGPFGEEKFGTHNDLNVFFSLDALTTNSKHEDGLLWVNHEDVMPLLTSDWIRGTRKTREQIQTEKLAVGGSVIRVRKEKGKWRHVPGSDFTRRFTALYPEAEMSGPVKSLLPTSTGTLGNCSGGKTLWQTVLTCEENFPNFNSDHGWDQVDGMGIDEQRYGWVLEVDPFGDLPPVKHSSLGRFQHENAAMGLGKAGRPVVYMGDDEEDQYFYKFVSAEKYVPGASRSDKRKLLTAGTLYVANFENGKWLPLDIELSPALKEAGLKSQADVLLNTRQAAEILKATPIDRPEDCEIHPKDGSIYLALTNNNRHGNAHGQIVRIVEDDDNSESLSFRYEIFLAGGPQAGMSSPDNLLFDKDGSLWVACDVSSRFLNKGAHQSFQNNGFFMVPTSGPATGQAFQFASAPIDAELTGPWFTDNGKTLFLSVQHPGERSTDRKKLTSHWPSGGEEIPRSAVVAITGF